MPFGQAQARCFLSRYAKLGKCFLTSALRERAVFLVKLSERTQINVRVEISDYLFTIQSIMWCC